MKSFFMAMMILAMATPCYALDDSEAFEISNHSGQHNLVRYEILPHKGTDTGFQAQLVSPVDSETSAFAGYRYTKAPEEEAQQLFSEDFRENDNSTMLVGLRFKLH